MATAKKEDTKVKSDKEVEKDELAALDALEKEASEFNKASLRPSCIACPNDQRMRKLTGSAMPSG